MLVKNNLSKLKYPSLNGLRAISIFFVIVYHSCLKTDWPQKFGILGNFGVNIFFVISGFLITSLLLEENNKNQTISLRNFYIRRTLRIFPAYYFYLLVLFILQIAGVIYIENSSWLSAVTYTKYFNWKLDWFTSHAWSLSVEEQFYLVWPLLFLSGNKIRKLAAFILVLFVPIFKLFLYYHPISWINELSIFTRIDAIAIGCLIALYKDELLKIIRPYFQIVFFLSIFTLAVVTYLPFINARFHLHLGLAIITLGTTRGTIANIIIGVILLYSVFGHQGVWFRILNSKILNYIGLLSYSLYLWQQLFISGPKYWVTSFPQNIIFVVIMALSSFYCIEQPFLKLKEKFQKS